MFKKIALIILCVALLASCSKTEKIGLTPMPNVTSGIAPKTISFAMLRPDTLCPLLTHIRANAAVFGLIYEGLFSLNESYSPVGVLAQSADSSAEGSVWTIHLKNGVIWHDGEPFSARDVVFSFSILQNEKLNSDDRYVVSNILSVKSLDDLTVQVNLKRPMAYFSSKLTFPIVAAHQFDGVDLTKSYQGTPIGTGALKVSEMQSMSAMKLKPFEGWHQKTPPAFEAEVKISPDMDALLRALSLGDIDVMADSTKELGKYQSKGNYSLMQYEGTMFDFVNLNQQNELLKDPQVRKAIAVAIDRNAIAKEVWLSRVSLSDFMMPKAWQGFQGVESSVNYSVEKAKELLKQAGFSDFNADGLLERNGDAGQVPLRFSFAVNNENAERVKTAEMISKQLKVVGIQCDVTKLPFEEMKNWIFEKKVDMALVGVSVYPDGDFREFFHSAGGMNIMGLNDAVCDRLLDVLDQSSTDEERKDRQKELMNYLYRQVPMVGLYFEQDGLMVKNSIKVQSMPNVTEPFVNFYTWKSVF